MPTKNKSNKRKQNQSTLLNLLSRSRLLIVVAIVTAFGVAATVTFADAKATNVRVGTYNALGQQWDGDTQYGRWSQREPRVKKIIATADPDVIGMQEVSARDPNNGRALSQRKDIATFMDKLGYDGAFGDITNSDPIFWKKDIYKAVARDEKLIVAGHPGKNQPAPRYLTYVRLYDGSKYLSVFNYHYNQTWGGEEQPERLRTAVNNLAVKGDPIIMTGDFNSSQTKVVRAIARLKILDKAGGVDHILGSDNIVTRQWRVMPQSKPAATDHRMLVTKLSLN